MGAGFIQKRRLSTSQVLIDMNMSDTDEGGPIFFSSSDESDGRGFQFSLYELSVCANNIMLNHVSSMKLRVFSLMKPPKPLLVLRCIAF